MGVRRVGARGEGGVPLQEVSEKWLRYYWPLIDSDIILPRIDAEFNGGKPIAFRGKLGELVGYFRRRGGLAAFERLVAEGSLSGEGAALKGAALRAIGSAIVKGPVQFAGGACGEPGFSWDKDSDRILGDGESDPAGMGHDSTLHFARSPLGVPRRRETRRGAQRGGT